MKYYKIQASLINKVVGYVASNKMVDIDAIEILKRAKMMDIIVSVPIQYSEQKDVRESQIEGARIFLDYASNEKNGLVLNSILESP